MIAFAGSRIPRVVSSTACLLALVSPLASGRDIDPGADGRIILTAASTGKDPTAVPAADGAARDTPAERIAPDGTGSAQLPDPLTGTEQIDPEKTGVDAEKVLARMLPSRSDSPADWHAGIEPLHFCGEPRLLAPCVPPPPCHPSQPPRPYDLIGVAGKPTCGPIYRGPCEPRTGSHDDSHLPRVHRLHDRFFDWFYTAR
jgi:hypothetical protein